mmetsp:Transcript_102373/g.293063  ORF Transcript_102373/g.293063 Transcript_102373/m.293063 type:complete len:201 (-) Transcript_102373:629-1231(-)
MVRVDRKALVDARGRDSVEEVEANEGEQVEEPVERLGKGDIERPWDGDEDLKVRPQHLRAAVGGRIFEHARRGRVALAGVRAQPAVEGRLVDVDGYRHDEGHCERHRRQPLVATGLLGACLQGFGQGRPVVFALLDGTAERTDGAGGAKNGVASALVREKVLRLPAVLHRHHFRTFGTGRRVHATHAHCFAPRALVEVVD